MTFVMTWDDDIYPPGGDPNDEFIMNITSPFLETYEEGPETSEEITIETPNSGTINAIPEYFEMKSESPETLAGEIADNYTGLNGVDDWIFNITLIEAGGIIPSPGDLDISNDWQIDIEYSYYSPIITRL
jgi:hypothetical protein